jgi:hypothetical protein
MPGDTGSELTGHEEPRRLRELLQQITDDLKTIARDEAELVRLEVADTARAAAMDAGFIFPGGIVALFGLGLLSGVAVVALAPIAPLWLRMLIMGIVYLAIGGGVGMVFAKRLKRSARASRP